MKVYSMKYSDLEYWVKNKAKPGDLATYYVNNGEFGESMYTYYYTKPDDNPRWCMWSDFEKLQKYLDNFGETKMEKKCENCKYFEGTSFETKIQDYWCTHIKYSGTRIARHTSCPEYAPKEMKTTPFDGIKFYLKDRATGELRIKYICEDCGKEMPDAPDRWWLVLPLHNKPNGKPGYHFRCEDCDKKERR